MQTPVLQFGTSRFLQAHADLFISEAMTRNAAIGPITIVQTTGSAERSGRLKALADPAGFPIHIRGKQDGAVVDTITKVTSVRRALSALSDWDEVARIASEEALVFLCNTADKGYDISMESPTRPLGIPSSFPGKLTKLLFERFQRSGHVLTVLPAELLPRNGDHLKAIVLKLADSWQYGPEFQDWLESHVVFSNTLVDRIVSEPLEPAGAVAEPYALWAIESRSGQTIPCRHEAIVVADDISGYERLKLFILNLGHTVLTESWLKADLPRDMCVRELLAIPSARERLEEIYAGEVLPGFAAMGMGDQAAIYIAATLERFENPFLNHRLADIAQNHAEKILRRIGGFLAWSGAQSQVLGSMLSEVSG